MLAQTSSKQQKGAVDDAIQDVWTITKIQNPRRSLRGAIRVSAPKRALVPSHITGGTLLGHTRLILAPLHMRLAVFATLTSRACAYSARDFGIICLTGTASPARLSRSRAILG